MLFWCQRLFQLNYEFWKKKTIEEELEKGESSIQKAKNDKNLKLLTAEYYVINIVELFYKKRKDTTKLPKIASKEITNLTY